VASSKDQHKATLQRVLTNHVGRRRAIGAETLSREVFGRRAPDSPERYQRQLRKLINELRRDGAAIGSDTDSASGGYYLMVGSEREEYAEKLKEAALGKLTQAARVLRSSLPQVLESMLENLKGGGRDGC
jgi:hypothetical protein